MLRIKNGSDEIEIMFDHIVCEPHHIESATGICVDEKRRCSSVTIKINGEVVGTGTSVCHPGDNFCKATGRKKALKLGLYSLNRKIRTAVWNEYKVVCGF